jgi:hypothetical protein
MRQKRSELGAKEGGHLLPSSRARVWMSWRVAAAMRDVCDAAAMALADACAGDDSGDTWSSTWSTYSERLLTASRNCCLFAAVGDDADALGDDADALGDDGAATIAAALPYRLLPKSKAGSKAVGTVPPL